MENGRLFLIPNLIAEGTESDVIPAHVKERIASIRYFLVEDVRTARRFLSGLKIYADVSVLEFEQLNKDTPESAIVELMKPLFRGSDMGIVSDAGCPGIADPGALAVAFAHQKKIEVIPMVGPSSVLLALMGSGLNGQQFAFHGYLPIDEKEATHAIKELERESKMKNQTQLFIETPYRNVRLFDFLLRHLHPETRLCIALDLTSPQERITTLPVREWKSLTIELPKSPAVFLFLA